MYAARVRDEAGVEVGRAVTAATTSRVDANNRPWTEPWPGVHWKICVEEGDRRAMLVRYDPGATIPRHRHLGDEQIFVLEGSVSDDAGTCTAELARALPAASTAS